MLSAFSELVIVNSEGLTNIKLRLTNPEHYKSLNEPTLLRSEKKSSVCTNYRSQIVL